MKFSASFGCDFMLLLHMLRGLGKEVERVVDKLELVVDKLEPGVDG